MATQRSETVRQVLDFLEWGFAPGGVILLALSQLPGNMTADPYVDWGLKLIGSLLLLRSAYKQYVSRKDASIIAAASQVKGVEPIKVDMSPGAASPGAVAAAISAEVPNVRPKETT